MIPDHLMRRILDRARTDRALAHAISEYRARLEAGIKSEWATIELEREAAACGIWVPRAA